MGDRTARAAVIYNPVAGGSSSERLSARVERRLLDAGFTVECQPTRDRVGAEPIARKLANRVDRLVVVGGDGSVREAIQGLGDARSRVVLGVVPQGNANVVAQELGLPRRADAAIEVAVSGKPMGVDLGLMESGTTRSLFLAVAGIGWDARTVQTVDRVRRTPLGRIWYRTWADSIYLVSGLAEAFRPGQSRFTLSVDGSGGGVAYCAAALCNLRTYGKGMAMAPDAGPGTGRIHVQGRKRASPADLVWHLGAAAAGRRSPGFISDYSSGTRIEAQAVDRPFAVEIDGDYSGSYSHLTVSVLPSAVRILVP